MPCTWTPIPLGPSGPLVVPLGIASSFGVGGADLERAFERGVNLFYWGSIRRPDFGRGLARIAARARDRMVLALQTYARWPSAMAASLERGLRALRVDHTDVLLLGWWNQPPPDRILDAARALVDRGLARQVMISCHHRPTFVKLAADPRVDLMMLRYSAAHPGAEVDVFPHLPHASEVRSPGVGSKAPDGPAPRKGIVAYTALSWGQLLDASLVPEGEEVPTSADCYRYVLSSPSIDASWCGPRDGADLDLALAALDRGPMSDEELAWMRRVGIQVRARARVLSRGVNLADRAINLVSGFGFKSSGGG
jgi:aryl-alcohol dehydrogenase-like predicted oxidoreductase